MFSIVGDGTYKNTYIKADGISIKDWTTLIITISTAEFLPYSKANVDGKYGDIDLIVLKGLYSLIGDGTFVGTNLYYCDIKLRGIQSMTVTICSNEHTGFAINGIFLPNVVDFRE